MLANVSANYLGLRLNSPIVIGSSPMTLNPETVRELAIAGAGAIVLPSLFEEQIEPDLLANTETKRAAASSAGLMSGENYREENYNGGPKEYLASIRRLKSATGLPVIGSLNGCSGGSWLTFAARMQEAGADALEFTFESAALDPSQSADEIEQRQLDCVSDLCDQVGIPVAVKLSPFHTNLPNLAWRLIEAGALGLICFAHDPNWRISTESIAASLNWALTPASDINQTISGLIRVRCGGPSISMAASGGLSSVEDIIKSTIAGADIAMLASEIYRSGPSVVTHLVEGIASYLDRHGFQSFDEFVRARPTFQSCLRNDYLHCLTQPERSMDQPPTPQKRIEGDRWGHVL
jgi:dihydroorotate dehydrogenase (fumarate)